MYLIMKSWMISDWLTDLLIDDKIMIMITKSVIILVVSGLYRPTGLLLVTLVKFWPSSGHKMTENGGFRPLSERKYSYKAIQTLCAHLLDECSELICIWTTLAKFWPSSHHKITENGGFWPISEWVPLCGIMITQSISNMVFTLVKGVFTNRPHRPNLAPLVTISVFPFPLIGPQAGTCILWCIVSKCFEV